MKLLKRYIISVIFLLGMFSLSVSADSFDQTEHTLDAVEAILKSSEFSNKLMTYTNDKGDSDSYEMTYGEAILAAGAMRDVSPLELATVIVQETGGKISALGKSPIDYIEDKSSILSSSNSGEVTYASFKTTTKVNYRTGAGTSYEKAGTLEKNTVIQVEIGYSKKSDGYVWYRFKNNNGNFYVASEYLEKVSSSTNDPENPSTPEITYTKYKTTTKVNYRDGAGTSYDKKGSLAAGTIIEVENGYSKTSNGYTWVRFKNSTGTYYIASEYLEKVTSSTNDPEPENPSTPEEPVITYTKYKTTTKVNYRDGAGTSYDKKGSLAAGTIIEVENGYSKTANGYTWVRFKNSTGIYYIASEYLEKVTSSTNDPEPENPSTPEEPVITYTKYKTTTKVNYRDGAGTSYDKKGSLAAGTVIEVENGYSKTANGYTWVRFKNSTGTYYVASEYLEKVTSSTNNNETPNTPDNAGGSEVSYTKYKTTTGVNYRNGAGTSYEKVGSFAAGTIIEVENGYSKTANGYTWVRFKTRYDSYYVALEFLTKVQ